MVPFGPSVGPCLLLALQNSGNVMFIIQHEQLLLELFLGWSAGQPGASSSSKVYLILQCKFLSIFLKRQYINKYTDPPASQFEAGLLRCQELGELVNISGSAFDLLHEFWQGISHCNCFPSSLSRCKHFV